MIRTDAKDCPDLIEGIHPCLGCEIAGIDEMHGIDFSSCLAYIGRGQGHEGMLLVAGLPSFRTGALAAIAQGEKLHSPFPAPGPVKGQHGKVLVVHIQTGGEHLGQIDRLLFAAQIGHADTSGDHIQTTESSILQNHL